MPALVEVGVLLDLFTGVFVMGIIIFPHQPRVRLHQHGAPDGAQGLTDDLFADPVPLVMAAVTFAVPSDRWRPWLFHAGALGHLGLVAAAIFQPAGTALSGLWGWLLLDPLGKVVLGFLSVFFFLCSLYAPGYLALRGPTGPTVSLLLASSPRWTMMTLVTLSQPPRADVGGDGEATTLITCSVDLLQPQTHGPWRRPGSTCSSARSASAWPSSVPSSWPNSAIKAGLEPTLFFDQLIDIAPQLSPPCSTRHFVLLFIGYGTKMGLAPMHTWKPDAYGEAPASWGPFSPGGFTSCAFLAILRVYQIAAPGSEAEFRPGDHAFHRPAVDGCRRRVHGAAARLQAHAGLLQRRAHGHPGPGRRHRRAWPSTGRCST